MENNNSVCFVGKILSISPIEGADKVELATINGWTSIVQKGIHSVGDLVLTLTTDAVIPQERCDVWGITSYLRKGNRVRTVKLRGVYSECILIPLGDVSGYIEWKYKEGKDLMDELKVFKYEPPIKNIQLSNGRKIKYKDNPNFHIYYKFPNQKNCPNMFNEEDEVVITRKIHGTNARYGIVKKAKLSILDRVKKFFGNKWIEYEYIYGSHNVEKGSDSQGFYSTDVWKEVADKYNIKDQLWNMIKHNSLFKDGIVIYGEIFGEGIQGEKYSYGLKEKQLQLFDITIGGEYQEHYSFSNIIEGYLFVPVVEELYIGKWSKEIQDSFVNNQFIEGTKTPHEGVVVKCISGDRKKISKVINPEYHIFSEKHLIPDSH